MGVVVLSIPAKYTVGVKTFSESGEDVHGNPVSSWSDPVDHKVCFWAPPAARGDQGEPDVAGHDRVVIDLELCVPEGFPAGPHDRIVVPGRGVFEVLGYPEDFNHGPWWSPGVVVFNLQRVEG